MIDQIIATIIVNIPLVGLAILLGRIVGRGLIAGVHAAAVESAEREWRDRSAA